MSVQKETPVSDDELDALMAELEAETADVVAAPAAVSTAPTSVPIPEPMVAQPVQAAATPVSSADDDLAALEAELAGATGAPWDESPAATAPAPKSAPTPAPAPELKLAPEPTPMPVEAKPAPSTPAEAIPMPTATQPKKVSSPLQLQHYIDMDQFKRDTSVSEARLDNCMMEQSGLRAHHGYMAANAEAQHSRLKLRFDVVEAALYDKHRKAILDSGEKATEKMVENAVRKDEAWVKAKNAVIEAELIVNVAKACVEALKDRRDMIIQLGADRREEGKGQARIMAQAAADRSLAERAIAAART